MPAGTAHLTKKEKLRELLRSLRGDKVGFAQRVLDVDPHAGQQMWLRNANKPENALTTGNRWGKSHCAAIDLIYSCVYRDGWDHAIRDAMELKHENYQAINVSYTADQAKVVWYKAYAMVQAPIASLLVDRVTMSPFATIIFINGAKLEARTTTREGVYLLGHDYDFVNWDEAAYEKHYIRIRDNVLKMRLVDRAGRLSHTSTGNGRNDYGRYFLNGLSGKDPSVYAQTGPTTENPNISQKALAETAARMSDKMRQQNVEGAIVDGGGEYFSLEDLNAAHNPDLTAMLKVWAFDDQDVVSHAELMPDGKSWLDKYPLHRYLHGWDLAEKRDWAVGVTYDVTTSPATLVEYERFRQRGWDYVYDRIRRRDKKYPTKRNTKIDNTGLGDVVENDLKDIGVEGVNFSGGRKDELLTNAQTLLSLRSIQWPLIQQLHDEHTFYERDDEGIVKDCVMANAVAGWWIKRRNVQLQPKLV